MIKETLGSNSFFPDSSHGNSQNAEAEKNDPFGNAKRKSQKSNPYYRNPPIYKTISDPFVIVDRQWRIVHINQIALIVLSRSWDELIGSTIWQSFPTIVNTATEAALRKVMNLHIPVRFESRRARTGRWYQAVAYPIEDGIACYWFDITEHKKAKDDARLTQERLALSLEASGSGVWDWNLITDEMWWSTTMYDLRGVNPEGEPPTGKRSVDMVVKEDRERIALRLRQVWERHEEYREEFRIDHPVRGRRWIASFGRTFYDPACRPVRMIGLNLDITDRKRMEEELQKYREILELQVKKDAARLAESCAELKQGAAQLSRLASELTLAEQRERRHLAEILHDHLQQYLVGAKIGLEVLVGHLPESHRGAVENIKELILKSIKTSRSLTVELSPPILYEKTLTTAIEWLAQWMKKNHGLGVEIETDHPLPSLPEHLTVILFQSVRELLFNVVKHARVNAARIVMYKNDDRYLRIAVVDQGVGFDPEGMWKKPESGGFGLFSIRERLQFLGGRLEIISNPGKGSSCTLVAPLR
jgi:two-component system CheB/CheR fusion protein